MPNHLQSDNTSSSADSTSSRQIPTWIMHALRIGLIVSMPVLFVLTSVRLVMTDLYLQIEYNRPGFPDDPFGFTRSDRLDLAPYAVKYLLNNASISYLGDLTVEDGQPLFNERELEHMEDVKAVTRAAFAIYTALGGAALVVIVAAIRATDTRSMLRDALFKGGALTLASIAIIVMVMLISWDTFFTNFHKVFFEGDSWLFRRSDTLIRLFPEQFWFDAALTVGGLTVSIALLSMAGAAFWKRRTIRNTPD